MTAPTPQPKNVEEILRRLRAGLNVEIEQDIAETKTALRQLLLAGVPERITKSSEGYPNAKELEAYRNGHNKVRDELTAYINKITE